jgi:hypothetical protein
MNENALRVLCPQASRVPHAQHFAAGWWTGISKRLDTASQVRRHLKGILFTVERTWTSYDLLGFLWALGTPAESTDPADLAALTMMSTVKIGDGERAAIAAAETRGLAHAMDDQRAWNRSAANLATIPGEDTASIVVSLIKAGVLSVAEADTIKNVWEANQKFTLTFAGFAEKI